MTLLLDTHAFLWWLADDPRLSPHIRALFAEGTTDLCLSVASLWEIALKLQAGKLRLKEDARTSIPTWMTASGVRPLPVQAAHALATLDLPPHHRDPFDRLLIAQCVVEHLPIATSDPIMHRYPVHVIW